MKEGSSCSISTSFSAPLGNMEHHRCAVALNNMGISLLEKQCYQQAVATFKAAVSLVREVCTTPTSPVVHQPPQTAAVLHAARQRLSQPHPDTRRYQQLPYLVETVSNSLSAKDIGIITETSCFFSSDKVSGPRTVIAIRIETLDTDVTAEMISAMLLHNFGVAYYCLSHIHGTKTADGRKYLLGSIRLSRISRSVLSKTHQQHDYETSEAPTTTACYHFLPIMMLIVLESLVTTLNEANRECEAQMYLPLVHHLRWMITQSPQGALLLSSFQNQRAASAA